MSARIMKLYTSQGLTPPVGKGEHTYAFHKRATDIMVNNRSMPRSEAYAIAMKQLGRNKSVKRSHWDMSRKYK